MPLYYLWAVKLLNVRKNLRRRVFIHHKHRVLSVEIARHNQSTMYVCMLLAFTVGFWYFVYTFVRPLFRNFVAKDLLYVLPFLAFLLVWYIIALRLAGWRAFGVEYISVEHGSLCWTRKALFWTRKREIPLAEVTNVRAVTPWLSLSNRVEFTAQGRENVIGDMLLRDEATELAHELQQAVLRME